MLDGGPGVGDVRDVVTAVGDVAEAERAGYVRQVGQLGGDLGDGGVLCPDPMSTDAARRLLGGGGRTSASHTSST